MPILIFIYQNRYPHHRGLGGGGKYPYTENKPKTYLLITINKGGLNN